MSTPQYPQGPEWGPTVQRPMPPGQPSVPGWNPQPGPGYAQQPPPGPYPPAPSAPGMPPPGMPPQAGYGQRPPMPAHLHPGAGGGGPKKHSSVLIIGLIVLGIVLAAGIGALISTMGGGDPEPAPTVSVSPTTTTATPSTTPSGTPTPTPTPTQQDTGGTLTLNGILITVPPGWKVGSKNTEKHFVQLVDADDNAISLQVFASGGKVSNVLVDEYLAQQMELLTNPRKYPVKKINVDPKLDVSEGAVSGTRTSSSGSVMLGLNTVMSVRGADQVVLMSTLVYNVRSDVDTLSKDYNTVTNSGMKSQAGG